MENEIFNVPLRDVKCELRKGIIECQKRGLLHSVKWLAEMSYGLEDIDCEYGNGYVESESNLYISDIHPSEFERYYLAKSYYDVQEYDRAAYFVRDCESPVPQFLYYYSTYMARLKRRLDSSTDQTNLNDSGQMKELTDLLTTLRNEYTCNRLDGYGMYLYGVVLKSLNLNQIAIQVFTQAIREVPMLWSAYFELSSLINDKHKISTLDFGGHWMRFFFIAHTYVELYLNDEALKAFEDLQGAGFRKCVFVTAQMALAYNNKRDVEKAIAIFQILQEADPYRLENMDNYSNLLFVKEMKTEMCQLAHKAVNINKYSPETCCVIGNYYSIRSDHQKAIIYFQRALKLNPKYLSAWTLMGHEFMELKNTNAAIQSYRKAIEVNCRDYRAWYGLGQSYEILKMYNYSLYYFKMSHKLRPYDSRMLVALGETYEKLDHNPNAIQCYWKACDVGDIEGIAMYKLAKLHEKLGDLEKAVHCYMMYCEDDQSSADKQCLHHGYITLANYYESKGQYDQASHYAYKCLESDDRKSEAKSLLKQIENKRIGKAIDNIQPHCASSSDEDMELDMSHYKFTHSDYLMPLRNTHNTDIKSSTATDILSNTSRAAETRLDSQNSEENQSSIMHSVEETPTTSQAAMASLRRHTVLLDDDPNNDGGNTSMDISTISID